MENKSITKNMIMSIILTSSNFVFPLITYSYVARVLNPDGTGRVAFVNSVLSYFTYIAILGIPTYGLREVSKYRDDKEKLSGVVQDLFVINILSTVIAYLLLLLSIITLPRLYSERYLFTVMGISILLNVIGMDWIYQAFEEYSYITIRSLIFKSVSVILAFLLVKTKEDVLLYGFVNIFATSASNIMNAAHLRKYIKFSRNHHYNLRKHIRPIFTLFAASVIITIYSNFDVTMIGFIRTEYDVGLYNAAMKIEVIVLSLSSAVTRVIIPRITYYIKKNDKTKVMDLLEYSLRISMDLAVPVAIYVFMFSGDCITLLCGIEYLPAVSALRVLIVCVFPLILTNLFGNQLLIPSGQEKRYSQSVLVGLIINVILNILLIPQIGYFGAAVGTLATECWNVYWMSSGVASYRNELCKRIRFSVYLIPLVVSIILSLTIGNLVRSKVIVKLLLSAVVFFVTYYVILSIEKEPIIRKRVNSIRNKVLSNKKD